MDAKEAIMQELGDFGQEDEKKESKPAVVADANPQDADDWWKSDSSVDPTKFEPYKGDVDLEDMTLFFDVEEDEPKSGMETAAEEDDDSVGEMTNAEYNANIDAATEAMMDPKMPEEMFQWGLKYIDKLAKKKRQSRLERVRNWDPEVINRCGWKIVEQMEAEERKERENFINNRG